MENRVSIGITGASGAIYAERLINELLPRVDRIYMVISEAACKVIPFEMKAFRSQRPDQEVTLLRLLRAKPQSPVNPKIRVFANDDLFAPIASGSSVPEQMVVIPCSMGTLARIRLGSGQTLLERAADVMIKESRRLILCPRESPFSALHLENMLALARLNVRILPPSPAFYHHQRSFDELVDSVVGKILECMGFKHTLYPSWNERQI